MNMGMAMPAWYDITGLDKRSNERCDGIDASRARLAKLIDEESMICTNPQASSSIEEESSRGPRVLVALAAGVATPRRVSVGGGYCAAMSAMDFAPS